MSDSADASLDTTETPTPDKKSRSPLDTLIEGHRKFQSRIEEMRRLSKEKTGNLSTLSEGLKTGGIPDAQVREILGDLIHAYSLGFNGGVVGSESLVNVDNLDFPQQAKLALTRESLAGILKDNPGQLRQIMNLLALNYSVNNQTEVKEEIKLPAETEIHGNERSLDYLGEKAGVVQFNGDNIDTLIKHLKYNALVLKSNNPDLPDLKINQVLFDIPKDVFDRYIVEDETTSQALEQGQIDKNTADYYFKLKNLYHFLGDLGIAARPIGEHTRNDKPEVLGKQILENYLSNGEGRTLALIDGKNPENAKLAEKLVKDLGPGQFGRAKVV